MEPFLFRSSAPAAALDPDRDVGLMSSPPSYLFAFTHLPCQELRSRKITRCLLVQRAVDLPSGFRRGLRFDKNNSKVTPFTWTWKNSAVNVEPAPRAARNPLGRQVLRNSKEAGNTPPGGGRAKKMAMKRRQRIGKMEKEGFPNAQSGPS